MAGGGQEVRNAALQTHEGLRHQVDGRTRWLQGYCDEVVWTSTKATSRTRNTEADWRSRRILDWACLPPPLHWSPRERFAPCVVAIRPDKIPISIMSARRPKGVLLCQGLTASPQRKSHRALRTGWGKVARLNLSIYGTRDAAQNWAKEYTTFLEECGFKAGLASSCNFEHMYRELKLMVHGDDFTETGPTADLQWMQRRKQDALHLGKKGGIQILNQTLRWTKEGIAYEADQRHAEIVNK